MRIVRHFILPVLVAITALAASMAVAQEKADENVPAEAETAGDARLVLNALLTKGGQQITRGLNWRLYGATLGADGKLPLLAKAKGGTANFSLNKGRYLVHLSYGYASAIRKIDLDKPKLEESINLNAGGLELDAVAAGDIPIQSQFLRFNIFSMETDPNTGRRKLIANNIKPGQIVPFPAGTYHVVSRYGKLNAETRADLQVEAGKVTQAILQQRAARITFRLASRPGGDAIADTAWSILTDDGTVISEVASTLPSMVLAEGNYTAVAKNNETTYSQNFEVKSGGNKDVEVLAEER